ncbi:DUF4178 domain-containing protein [Qipengyuania sp. 1XM1-15A]|uniref:DUF4178 domain-containing protein n=1 Tax=Qipengyuania xiamenensis TaxID=2867237 RepID=UPI001C88B314|nr:DUF4178 domain-containing protein [Qipengyuania xiamenensis]MBX7532407.1 DUF4178 domain-containing protein [Qipengyuania xiamenensis]
MTTDAVAPSVKAITCPSCGGTLELRASGFSTLIVCLYCGSELDLTNPQVKLLAEHAQAGAELVLPIGSRGHLKGTDWTVIGYLERNDGWSAWGEYLLFNPYEGYRWLIHQDAGWSFGVPFLIQPGSPRGLTQKIGNEYFKKCFRETTNTVDYVLGEFYWQVRKGDQAEVNGYVSGNRMLSCEIVGDGYEWTMEEWVSSTEVAEAFGIENSGQYPETGTHPLPHQPNPNAGLAGYMFKVGAAALLLALVFAIVFGSSSPRSEVSLLAGNSPQSRQVVIEPFTITGSSQPFTIDTRGEPGDNSWLDVEYVLTNMDTGESRVANQPIEYYFGGNWREDDRRGTIKLSSVPPGRYSLEAEVIRPEDERGAYVAQTPTAKPVEIVAGPGGIFWSNLFLLFVVLFGPAFWVLAKAMSFEAVRRDDYDYGHDDDD